MERPKNTGRKKINNRDKNITLEVFCMTPKPEVQEDHDTSIYEIDIHGNPGFTSCSFKAKSVDASSKELDLEGNMKSKGSPDPRNHFIQSYYPKFVENSDFKGIELRRKETESTEQVELVEEEKEPSVGKADPENQSHSDHSGSRLEKQLMSYIMDHFFSSSNKDLKGLFQKYENKSNCNGVHLHHHEHHHHHYYLDKSLMNEVSEMNENGMSSPKTAKGFFKNKISSGYEPDEEREELEKEITDFTNYYAKSNMTFSRTKVDSDGKSAETKHVRCTPSLRFKASASVESVFRKKSDSVKCHVYSDTDLTKRDSDETADAELLEGNLARAGLGGKSNYSLLVKSLKAFNQFKLPVVITDQKTLPKVSYITCHYSSSDLLKKVTNIVPVNAAKVHKKKSEVQKTPESEDSMNRAGINERMGNSSSKRFRFEIWTTKLKEELKDIKNELRKLAERHSKKLCNGEAGPNLKRTRRISVYSSRTFVVSPDDVGLKKKLECKRVEKNSEFLFDEKGLVLSGTQVMCRGEGAG